MIIRRYRELVLIPTFEERYEYLKLSGEIGKDTFGFDRYINQNFYRSYEWKKVRNEIIARDYGYDLGVEGYEIGDRIIIHHMNPIDKNDIIESSDYLLNPDYMICVSHRTHNAIHYGSFETMQIGITERKPNDTCPWRK